MKTVLKKFLTVSLSLLVISGAASAIKKVPVQNVTNNQYVFFRNSSHSKLIRTPHDQKSQSSTNTTAVNLPQNTQESSNWAGYIVTPTSDTDYTSVSGSWTVPNIPASRQNAVAAEWIGLGGVNSSDLLQIGTVEQIENGQPTAEIFWEKLPDTAQNVMSVPIGSTINASISKSSDSMWDLTFTVNSSGSETQTKTISVTLDSSYEQGIKTSAEWISEDPSNTSGQLYPLADMGIVKYQSAAINSQPINAAGNNVQPVAMVSSNKTILISPSTLGTDNESFTTTCINSTSSNPLNIRKRIPLHFWDPRQNSFRFN